MGVNLFVLIQIFLVWTSPGQMLKVSKSLDDCLHRYLEKDFGSLEDSMGRLSDGHPASEVDTNSETSKQTDCLNWQSMLSCYKNANNVKNERHYNKLVAIFHELKNWVCHGDTEQYKDFLGGIQCATKLSPSRLCISSIKNKWEKFLRLEFGNEICKQFIDDHECLLDKMSHYCHRRSIDGYNKSMTIILDIWCYNINEGDQIVAVTYVTVLSATIVILMY